MITSTANSQIKNVMKLQTQAKARNKAGQFIVEGIRMCVEIPKDRIVKIYISESFYNNLNNSSDDNIKQLTADTDYELVEDNVFKQMSDTVTPQGILTIVNKKEACFNDILDRKTYLILENIQDPGNLGTILRTAEGAGATGIIMSDKTVDIYNPKTIRSTMGSLFRMPFVYSEDVVAAVHSLKQQNIKVFAAHLEGRNYYYEEDMKVPMAVLIGNEGNGLTEELSKEADVRIKIPMEGKLESLNAAVSTAVILYEAMRQRHIQP